MASFDGTHVPKVAYRSGALEHSNPCVPVLAMREEVWRILESGTKSISVEKRVRALLDALNAERVRFLREDGTATKSSTSV